MGKLIEKSIEDIERRFLEVSNLEVDLSVFPIHKKISSQTKTNKQKSKDHGEVFSPLWLVDEILMRTSDYDWMNQDRTTLDLCAGYGQFTIRMIRKKYSLLGESFDLEKFLKETHSFNELLDSSCEKLRYIFGKGINLFQGDSRMLKYLKEDSRGSWTYCEADKVWKEAELE